MKIQTWSTNPHVRTDLNKVAILRGSFIYCLEEEDNGKNLHLIGLEKNQPFNYRFEQDLFGGAGIIKANAKKRMIQREW